MTDSMADIISLGTYYHSICDDVLPNIKSEVDSACKTKFRRIDRFTQLCLLGSARCMNSLNSCPQMDPNNTGLYIASRFAALSNTIKVHDEMLTKGQTPRPANFINTLSNSAGFYVAQNLALNGKNIFVSRADQSTEAVFDLATMDIASGQISQALIGIVEESAIPSKDHRKRLGVDKLTPLAEASHWFLITAQADRPKASIKAVMVLDKNTFKHWFSNQMTSEATDIHIYAPIIESSLSALLESNTKLAFYSTAETMHYSPARTAGVIQNFIEANEQKRKSQTLISVQVDADDRFHVIKISV